MKDENTSQTQDGDSSDEDDAQQKPLPEEKAATADQTADEKDYETLLAELKDSKTKLTELTTISQQALADLQNYKKRSEEEKAKFVSFANATLISMLLPTLDNLERATAIVPEDSASKEWTNGIIAIFKQLEETLKTQGLATIVTADQQFDPNLHEAVMTEAGPTDKIMKEMEKGYKIADRVIRRSKVVVGNDKAEATAAPPETTNEEADPEPSPDDNPIV